MKNGISIYWIYGQPGPRLSTMSDALRLLTVQFLAWVAERPRTYAETMEAWRTSCPRLSVWEDATLDGLVSLKGGPDRQTMVELTSAGEAQLRGQPASSVAR